MCLLSPGAHAAWMVGPTQFATCSPAFTDGGGARGLLRPWRRLSPSPGAARPKASCSEVCLVRQGSIPIAVTVTLALYVPAWSHRPFRFQW